jgi:hypothetical protein
MSEFLEYLRTGKGSIQDDSGSLWIHPNYTNAIYYELDIKPEIKKQILLLLSEGKYVEALGLAKLEPMEA